MAIPEEKADPRGVAVVVLIVGLVVAPVFLNGVGAALAILGTLALVAGGVIVGHRIVRHIRWSRPTALLPEPVPAHWAEAVRVAFPLAQKLDAASFERLLKLIQVFLRKKRFEGAGGLEVSEDMRLTVAAQACLLVLRMEVGLYPALKTIILYPGAVVPRHLPRLVGHGVVEHDGRPQPILGQSWGKGVVILSWDSAEHGAFDPRDGHNVVLHEFAHQLDQETGEADGIPVGVRLSSLKPWAEMLESQFRSLRTASRKGRKTVMDSYGATNRAEFFAVATETFFEKPRQLRSRRPEVYRLLSEFYGFDPAENMLPRRNGQEKEA